MPNFSNADYPNSYYAATMDPPLNAPYLSESIETDICIIGAGITGLTCAARLAEAGKSVTLIEAERVGFGASGRNGGFVAPGFAQGIEGIEKRIGQSQARMLYDMSRDILKDMRDICEGASLSNIRPQNGQMNVIRYNQPDHLRRYQEKMHRDYDAELTFFDRDNLQDILKTDAYFAGLLNKTAFHFHPLNYCLALARKVQEYGGQIYEQSPVNFIHLGSGGKEILCDHGRIKAKQIVIATGGYSTGLVSKLRAAMLPIATYVVTTEKIGTHLCQAIDTSYAILDDRRASDYYRIVDEDRLLWGGRITALTAEPRDLAEKIHNDMSSVYPQLKDTKVEFSWMGLMGYARHLMPQIGQMPNGLYYAISFGGHGLNSGSLGGKVIAEAILGEPKLMRSFSEYGLDWNGGLLGPLAVQATYWHYQMMDWMRERGWVA